MMNAMSQSTARSLDFQPAQSGRAAAALPGLSTEKHPLVQSVSGRMRRAASTTMATLERSVLQRINQHRQQNGLAALQQNRTIAQQARQHSQSMATQRVLSHDGFSGRVQRIGTSIPLRASAENVAFNQGFSDPVAQAVNGWLRSPGHLRNIMGNFSLTGIGVARNPQGEFYFTQIFIRR